MTYDTIFAAYYNLYRLEAETPTTADDEYTVGVRLANEAINRWAAYDGVYWKELFANVQTAADGDKVLTTATSYAAPTDMKEAGGYVRVRDGSGTVIQHIPIVEPQEAQFKSDLANFCYFLGDPNSGFTLELNAVPAGGLVGGVLDYVYYKKPTLFNQVSPGDTATGTPEMTEPYFIVHRMLASRFRGSRNPYYGDAKMDAEDLLKIMKMSNDSGNWSNPWKLPDNSGTTWGESWGS